MILWLGLRLSGAVGGLFIGAVMVCWLVGGLIPAQILAYQSVGRRSDIMTLDIARRMSVNLTRNPLNSDMNPVWSPDGQFIVFESHGSTRDGIYRMDFAGRDVQPLVNSPGTGAPAWSPDGTWIAYTAPVNGANRIFVIHSNGGQPQPVIAGQTFNYDPVWSPDSTLLAFQGGNYDDYYVYLAAIGGRESRRLVISDPAWEVQDDPAWSPDGRTMAFVMRLDIYIVPVDGSTPDIRQLTDSPYFSGNPAWSPDGRQLAYDEERHLIGSTTPQQTIRLINVDGTDDTELVAGLRPAWRP